MDCSSRSGDRRLMDRLSQLLLCPANTFLGSRCSSSSLTSTVFTGTAAAAATTLSISSTTTSTSTTAANYAGGAPLSRPEPFSAALDRPPPERMRCNKEKHKDKVSTSSRYSSRRRSKNAVDKGGVRTLSSNPYGFTSSGEEDDGTDGYGDDDDTETFLSSRSLLSFDSSGFYAYRKLLKPPSKHRSHISRQGRRRRCCRRPSASCVDTCNAGSVREPGFRPLVVTKTATAAALEQVPKGLAVVKRSRDPYGDFLESMVEMIMGRQVFGAAELQRLLRSYLSLNAPRFHPVILQAFSDIWVVLHVHGV